MKKRILLLFLSVAIVLSNITLPVVAASDNDQRQVYLHASENPDKDAPPNTDVYVDKSMTVYLAVDEPNKGKGGNAEDEYILNGYFVRLYYNPEYLTLNNVELKDGDLSPLNFELPDMYFPNGSNDTSYQYYANEYDAAITATKCTLPKVIENASGKYSAITALVFFNSFELPERDVDWYNILGVNFTPKKTGVTDVYIDTQSFDGGDTGFQLFAKDVYGRSPVLTSRFKNGGRHTLNIKNLSTPPAPEITPATGTYGPNAVELKSVIAKAQDGCYIYWTDDENAPDYYNENYKLHKSNEFDYIKDGRNNAPIDQTTTLKCLAVRVSDDGKEYYSNVVSRTYKIVPDTPWLFVVDNVENGRITSASVIEPPYYPSDGKATTAYSVTIDDGNTWDGQAEDLNNLYYTFTQADESEILNYDTIPEGERNWIKYNQSAEAMLFPIEITKNCNIRIVTERKKELSSAREYILSISPAPVYPSIEPSDSNQKPVDIELICENKLATIYYTLDGSDPRIKENRKTYIEGQIIPISDTTILKTVAQFDGAYSEVKEWLYDFGIPGSLWVDASRQSGGYDEPIEVHLISANADDTIYYTTDLNADLSDISSWTEYNPTKPLDVSDDMTFKAVAKNKDGDFSDVKTFTYYISPKAPEFAPPTTQFSPSGEVAIYSHNDGDEYEIWYTTDSTDPRDSNSRIEVKDNYCTIENIDKYTVIKAVVVKKNSNGDVVATSDVVMETYDAVTSKPPKPMTTLIPGIYTIQAGQKGYSTQFVKMSGDINIYYTFSNSNDTDNYPPDLAKGSEEWTNENIPITGETIINAVAEDSNGNRSQIGTFYYKIIPAAPVVPESSSYTDIDFIPVTVVEGSEITYTINGEPHTIPADKMDGRTTVYINTQTGKAHADDDINSEILDDGNVSQIGDEIKLTVSCEKDGVPSDTTNRQYNKLSIPSAPFVTKNPGGTYIHKSQPLVVELDTIEKDSEIWYCIGSENVSDTNNWQKYNPDEGIEITKDAELYAKVIDKNGDESNMIHHYYTFVPPVPEITPPSGTYNGDDVEVTIGFPDDASIPDGSIYVLKYTVNGGETKTVYFNQKSATEVIDSTSTVKAWIEEQDSKTLTKTKESEPVVNYYFISDKTIGEGKAQFVDPFDYRTRFAAWELNNITGIRLKQQAPYGTDYEIRYEYKYQVTDGTWYPSANDFTDDYVYNNVPISVSPTMKQIVVHAWLTDKGNKVADSDVEGTFTFVKLGIPQPTPDEGSYTSSQTVKIENEYDSSKYPYRWIYYTTDNNAVLSKGEFTKYTDITDNSGISITKDTTLRTVYYDACGECMACLKEAYELCSNSIWGEVGEFKYYITKSTGGGGGGGGGSSGGGSTTTKKQYTIDHFGNEHPHHTNYLYGYPDGTVQGDGNITREETAAILYRVYHIDYVEPHPAQGDQYPDVTADMWSAASIEYLSDVGLIMGYPDGTYMPRNQITRAEFVAMITRWLKLDTNVKLTSKDTKFSDLEESHWAYNEIYALSKMGYIKGYEDGTFRPQQPITRAEAVTIINRILGRKPDRSYLQKSDFNPYTDLHGDEWYYEQILEATINHYYDLKDTENPWHLQIND